MKRNKIIVESNLEIDEVLKRVSKGIGKKNFLTISSKIMSGSLKGEKIKAVINPSASGLADPFKAVVEGEIILTNKGTKIELETRLGLISIFCCLFWFVPFFDLLNHYLHEGIYPIFLLLMASVIPSFITYLLLV